MMSPSEALWPTHISVLNGESVLQARLEQLKHLGIGTVVADVVENVLVGDDVERTEDDDDGNVVADVRQRGLDRLTRLWVRRR